MRKFYFPFILLSVTSLVFYFQNREDTSSQIKKLTKEQRIDGAIEYYRMTSSDVDLGVIPYDKLFKAIDEGRARLQNPSRSRTQFGSIADPVWRERGPNNVGGRTRAIMIDESDPSRNRIWVGGVSGGLWRTEDITREDPQWEKLGLYFESLAISDIAQHPIDHHIIYVSTGESYTGAVQGTGIFKSVDGGASWTLLPSTANSVLSTINEVYVHHNGDVYAASTFGLFRSKNGGGTWVRVNGTGIDGASSNNFHDFYFHEVNQAFYTSNDNSIYISMTGDSADWTSIGLGRPGFPNDVNRIEFAVCATNPEVLYAIGAIGSFASNTYITNNGGDSWAQRSEPTIFTDYGQAWYDLDINSDPFNCTRLLSGGVLMALSTTQGFNWDVVATSMHVDHHNITFDPEKQNRVIFGNDGGIWLSGNGGLSSINKSLGYVTTQFYAGAIHPGAGSSYALGGTQDNSSLAISEPGLSPAESVWSGDGMFCFIDQNEPNIQIVSSQGGNYGLSINGGISFGLGASINGAFVNRSGYDDNANLLYGQVNEPPGEDIYDFFRWNISNYQVHNVDIIGRDLEVSAIKADPNVSNRVFFGGQNGIVVRVDNAHVGDQVSAQEIAHFPGGADVSCIYMDGQNSEHILVSLFSFGSALENLWATYNGGAEWTAIEGDLPDLPVRWALFDPADHDRAMIATDAGVWTTDDINGNQTHWEPTDPDNGMPFVRVDMLLMRESDKVVLAATYGRGLMTTDVFSAPAAVIVAQPIAYEGQSIEIDGSFSVNAEGYEWNFGDNTTSNESTVHHIYEEPGKYTITLTINDTIIQTEEIIILPYLPAPYEQGESGYAGDFENEPEHFAAFTQQGTPFSRGASTKSGKDGTNSGANAWVLGINDNLYQNNTRAELYTPMYDLSEPGLYELKFFSKYAVQNRNDGFQIEYSLNAGVTWTQLGTTNDPGWYNYYNAQLMDGAFPIGKSYFTNAQLNWTQYVKDISFLAGEPTVSFRYVFRSDDETPALGLAIDDFEVTKYKGELATNVTIFEAAYTDELEVTINWTTGIEYQCQNFILERSYTGIVFDSIASIQAKGVVSTYSINYSRIDPNSHKVIYYRLKVFNENNDLGYLYEFYTDPVVVRRDVDPNVVQKVYPSPFKDFIGIVFSSVVNESVVLRLFDASGALIWEDIVTPNAVSYQIDQLNLPAGIYILTVKIGDEETKAFKLLTGVR